MMRVLSDVYPSDVKPVRDGWYLTRLYSLDVLRMTYWDGSAWIRPDGRRTFIPEREWQGLAFCPDGAIPDVKWLAEHPGAVGSSPVGGVFVPGAQCE